MVSLFHMFRDVAHVLCRSTTELYYFLITIPSTIQILHLGGYVESFPVGSGEFGKSRY